MKPALRRLLVRYTLLGGAGTVGVLVLVGYGPLLLVPLFVGTVLLVVGGGAAGDATVAGVEGMDAGGGVDDSSEGTLAVGSGAESAVRPRAKLVFYGLGLVVWSVLAMVLVFA